jgi:hypothetical protein
MLYDNQKAREDYGADAHFCVRWSGEFGRLKIFKKNVNEGPSTCIIYDGHSTYRVGEPHPYLNVHFDFSEFNGSEELRLQLVEAAKSYFNGDYGWFGGHLPSHDQGFWNVDEWKAAPVLPRE